MPLDQPNPVSRGSTSTAPTGQSASTRLTSPPCGSARTPTEARWARLVEWLGQLLLARARSEPGSRTGRSRPDWWAGCEASLPRIGQSLLTIRREPQNAHLVSLHGELDGATAKELDAEFIRIEATSVSRIVLDLRGLEFIDSTGLAVILRADTRAKNDGHVLRVLRPDGPNRQVGRAFELSGLDAVLAAGPGAEP
jgi:anti-sigma B factor antagonist